MYQNPELQASLKVITTYKDHGTFDPVEVLVSHVGKSQDFRMLWDLVGVGGVRAAAKRAMAKPYFPES